MLIQINPRRTLTTRHNNFLSAGDIKRELRHFHLAKVKNVGDWKLENPIKMSFGFVVSTQPWEHKIHINLGRIYYFSWKQLLVLTSLPKPHLHHLQLQHFLMFLILYVAWDLCTGHWCPRTPFPWPISRLVLMGIYWTHHAPNKFKRHIPEVIIIHQSTMALKS